MPPDGKADHFDGPARARSHTAGRRPRFATLARGGTINGPPHDGGHGSGRPCAMIGAGDLREPAWDGGPNAKALRGGRWGAFAYQ